MGETKIVSMSQTTRYNSEMKPQEVYVIKFNVGESGPFTVEVPIEGYTSSAGQAAVQQRALEIKNTLGV